MKLGGQISKAVLQPEKMKTKEGARSYFSWHLLFYFSLYLFCRFSFQSSIL